MASMDLGRPGQELAAGVPAPPVDAGEGAAAVLGEIARQAAAMVESGQVPLYVRLGNDEYAALEARLGPAFGDVQVDEPAGEAHAAPEWPVHFRMAAGPHVLGVQRLDVAAHLHVIGSDEEAAHTLD